MYHHVKSRQLPPPSTYNTLRSSDVPNQHSQSKRPLLVGRFPIFQTRSLIMCGHECEPCGREFRLFKHYRVHMMDSARHHYCAPCDRDFKNEAAKQQHLRHSERHMICRWCRTEVAGTLRAHNQNYHEQCARCKKWFDDLPDLHKHYQSEHDDLYCAPCQRLFQNHNSILIHLKSSAHLPKKFGCTGGGCGRGFISKSALVLHLEAGTCRSVFDLTDVDREFSRHCDLVGLFVRKNILFPAPPMEINADEDGLFPCRFCTKTFKCQAQLMNHLKSPKHKNRGRKPYVCPSRDCLKAKFRSLGSLLLHIENSDCGQLFEDRLTELVNALLEIVKQTT
ncbi:hypothetical protein PCASD_16103 [Puccinia coronata f. sp. avenae]|uniref:C2H2-type domain-containing protein n=1 Tax=Puccinia coronata f. sp. avenae TaxID=200324 RepID=A0A2N5TY28_9BASI|nr:hypothetical protein PCASD_16103 [Puccinia coronata f. sp. avenae]